MTFPSLLVSLKLTLEPSIKEEMLKVEERRVLVVGVRGLWAEGEGVREVVMRLDSIFEV